MQQEEPRLLRLAIPNKGRIAQPIMDLVEKSGLHLERAGTRKLITKTCDPEVEVLFARPIDIPEYVANGAADLGITGKDMVMERGADVETLLDLRMGKATLVIAVPEDSAITSVQDLEDAKVATEFSGICKHYFAEMGISVTLVPVGGACEATPYLGIADAIVDLSSSGTTLATNHLRVVENVLHSSTVLIANRDSLRDRKEKMDEIHLALDSVITAQGQCYLMMNVQRAALDEVRSVLPGLSGPTVMDVASSDDLVAVHAVVAEKQIYSLISALRRAGARDILVMPIERMIR